MIKVEFPVHNTIPGIKFFIKKSKSFNRKDRKEDLKNSSLYSRLSICLVLPPGGVRGVKQRRIKINLLVLFRK